MRFEKPVGLSLLALVVLAWWVKFGGPLNIQLPSGLPSILPGVWSGMPAHCFGGQGLTPRKPYPACAFLLLALILTWGPCIAAREILKWANPTEQKSIQLLIQTPTSPDRSTYLLRKAICLGMCCPRYPHEDDVVVVSSRYQINHTTVNCICISSSCGCRLIMHIWCSSIKRRLLLTLTATHPICPTNSIAHTI